MIIVDHILDLIDAELATPAPERGGLLLAATDTPVVTEALLDPSSRPPCAAWWITDELAGNLAATEARTTAARLCGVVHSHPAGFDQPSAQDLIAAADLLVRNPALRRVQLPIVTRWADLPPDAADRLAPHEVALEHGKLSWFAVASTRAGEPVRAETVTVTVLPLHAHARALADALDAEVSALGTEVLNGLALASARITGGEDGDIEMLTPPGYPMVAPIVCRVATDGTSRVLPVNWDLGIDGPERLTSSIEPARSRSATSTVAAGPGQTPAPEPVHDAEGVDRSDLTELDASDVSDAVNGPVGGSPNERDAAVLGSMGRRDSWPPCSWPRSVLRPRHMWRTDHPGPPTI